MPRPTIIPSFCPIRKAENMHEQTMAWLTKCDRAISCDECVDSTVDRNGEYIGSHPDWRLGVGRKEFIAQFIFKKAECEEPSVVVN